MVVFSRRILHLKESGTLMVIDKVKELQSRGVSIIQLDVGEPDFKTPNKIVRAAQAALKAGFTHYTPSAGISELREAVATKLRSENGLQVKKENVIITPGSKQALFYAVMALVDAGDEVIIPTPAWPSYAEMVTVAGGLAKEVRSEGGFGLNIEGLKEAVTERTRLIIINSPNNPTGHVVSKEELKAVADIAKDKGIHVVSDEIYEKILYDGSHISIGSFPGMEEYAITVNGFSKAYAMTGWRLGYLAASRSIISATNKLQQHSASCPASFVQMAALEALKPDTPVQPMVEEFKRRRDYLCDALRKLKAFKITKPAGAFYIFPDISRTGMSSTQLCDLLLEKGGVSTTPGEAFGGYDSNLRISYANSMKNLKEAVYRIETLLNEISFLP
jgi:aspartate aminotransferase